MPTLEVHQLDRTEVYRDIVRVNQKYRIDARKTNCKIKEGEVCRIRVNGRQCLVVLRGYEDNENPEIRMDDFTRGPYKLNVGYKQKYEFEFTPVRFIGKVRWAWQASEMGYQVATRLAVLGLLMGLVGFLWGVDWHWIGDFLQRVFRCFSHCVRGPKG
jgi:hypothetical protein